MSPKKLKIHFIGIGGIGTSALAKYYLKNGANVSGSDLIASEITKDLQKLGAKIFIGEHKEKNLSKDTDLVIYSPAIEPDNPEIKKAKNFNIKIKSYPQALGELTKKYFTIAVCGTHGKSTTTAMISLILTKAKLDPTVILGTKLKEFNNSNCRVGKSKYLVIEADEHFESFLNYWPQIIILTNLEPDHLDYYQSFENYIIAFKKFISHLPKEGYLILNKDDSVIKKESFFKTFKKIKTFSLKGGEKNFLTRILKIPGKFNILNSLAAIRAAQIIGISKKTAIAALSKYKGAWRRFEVKKVKLKGKKITIVHDYGHHPTEVFETLNAAREKFKNKKIICVFQPHQYQRTFLLFGDFVKVLKKVPIDILIITDIYDVPGRENKKIKNIVSSEKLQQEVKRKSVIYVPKKRIINFLRKNINGGEVVVFMGAGDIYNFATKFFS